MDRSKISENLKALVNTKAKIVGLVSSVVAMGAIGFAAAKPHVVKQVFAHSGVGQWSFHGMLEPVGLAWESVQDKVDALHKAEADAESLKLENAHLRLKLESLQFDCHAADAELSTKQLELKLTEETWSKVGHSLASIQYKHPGHLLPAQLYTLGVSYFKGREDEKAAEILSFLTGLEENSTYKSPRNFLMTGVAWYRLDNFDTAEHFFDKVMETPDTPENLPFHAHARLWKALVSERLGKHTQSQSILRDLVDHHPHSTEADWVNSMEGNRAPATSDED